MTKCICWHCGRDIDENEDVYQVDEELWCEDCFDRLVMKAEYEMEAERYGT